MGVLKILASRFQEIKKSFRRKVIHSDCKTHGILKDKIILFSVSNAGISSKISIDGKKINSGFGKVLGEVDLFGHESVQKQRKGKRDLKMKNRYNMILRIVCQGWRTRKIQFQRLMKLIVLIKNIILQAVQILTTHPKEVRDMKLKNRFALKYSYAISLMQTFIYMSNECIN